MGEREREQDYEKYMTEKDAEKWHDEAYGLAQEVGRLNGEISDLHIDIEKARQRGFDEAKEMAAQVIDQELYLREKFDEHMEPIDKLAAAIRSLQPVAGGKDSSLPPSGGDNRGDRSRTLGD